MRFGLESNVIRAVHSVLKKHTEIERTIIYGSRAKGNFRTGSDIDLTLLGGNLTDQLLSTIAQELDDLNTPYLFDLSIFNQLQSQDLKEHIDRVGQIFYQRGSLN